MNVVSIASPVLDHASVRDAFAQAAYAGRLPRDRWVEAQGLVGAYDGAPDDAGRLAAARSMATIDVLPDYDQDGYEPTGRSPVGIAA